MLLLPSAKVLYENDSIFKTSCKRNPSRTALSSLWFGPPLVLLFLLSLVNSSIPAEANNTMFAVSNLAPGLAMFGTAFMALFAGSIVAKDRASSFLMRLFASPMTAADYIMGYTIPIVAMALGQSAITFLASLLFGLHLSASIIIAVMATTVTALLFIGLGLLCGTLLSDKAVEGICGALVTNLAGWLSGVFMPIDLIGGTFRAIAHVLPFYHSVEAIKLALETNTRAALPHLGIVLIYAFAIYLVAIIAFKNKMKGDQI